MEWNVTGESYGNFPTDSANELLFPASAMPSPKFSEIEREVMELFEQFRSPLLRYVLSFGLPVHDGEEVTQEVFVSLFRRCIAQIPPEFARVDFPRCT